MSEIIENLKDRLLGNIVEYKGSYYYVDSAFTFDWGCYETMVFGFDFEKQSVISWHDIYCQRYETYEEMEEQHFKICNEIENYIEENRALKGLLKAITKKFGYWVE